MECTYCGRENAPQHRYCYFCGKLLQARPDGLTPSKAKWVLEDIRTERYSEEEKIRALECLCEMGDHSGIMVSSTWDGMRYLLSKVKEQQAASGADAALTDERKILFKSYWNRMSADEREKWIAKGEELLKGGEIKTGAANGSLKVNLATIKAD